MQKKKNIYHFISNIYKKKNFNKKIKFHFLKLKK